MAFLPFAAKVSLPEPKTPDFESFGKKVYEEERRKYIRLLIDERVFDDFVINNCGLDLDQLKALYDKQWVGSRL